MRQEVNNGKTVLGHLSLSPSLSFYPLFLPYILLFFIKNLKGKRLNVEQATPTTEKVFCQDHTDGFRKPDELAQQQC